ncbi:hypothetical protein HDU93_001275 [Gonapodya sp. JEL0774]|nr:hypothetical protein HDU93_001275 [Gonapodya sp. JEL0774]
MTTQDKSPMNTSGRNPESSTFSQSIPKTEPSAPVDEELAHQVQSMNNRGIPLKWIISVLLLVNVVVIAVPSITLGAITNNQSISTASETASYFTTAGVYLQSVVDVINHGIVDLKDVDRLVPFMKDGVQTIGLKANVQVTVLALRNPPVVIALQPIIGPNATQVGMIQTWATNNFTCMKFCPVRNTNGSLNGYLMDEVNGITTGSPLFSLPFNVTFVVNRDVNFTTPQIVEPYISPDGTQKVVQAILLSVWDPVAPLATGNEHAAYISQQISVENLSGVLDNLKQLSGTPNSTFYLLTSQGSVMAMSGLGNATEQNRALVTQDSMGGHPKTMFELSENEYPFFNYTAQILLKYANNDLASNFKDHQWRQGGYMFQVTSVVLYNFKYIIVSGAPEADYLGETLFLSQKLSSIANRGVVILSISISAIVLALTFLSVTFTNRYISTPLAVILEAMKKAVKFDFSAVRNGGLVVNQSIVREIGVTQSNFLELLKSFADSLKQNKQLMRNSPSGTASTNKTNNVKTSAPLN